MFRVTLVCLILVSAMFATSNIAPARNNAKCAIATFDNELKSSKSVFIGKAVKVSKDGDSKIIVFEVRKYWKGVASKEVTITVSENMRYQSMYEEGETYLVFAKANEDSGSLYDYRCSRSAKIGGYSTFVKDDIKKLGKAKTCIDLKEDVDE